MKTDYHQVQFIRKKMNSYIFVIGTVVTGLMGIELEINPHDMACEWGGYVDRFITMLPRLTGKTSWVRVSAGAGETLTVEVPK